MTYLAYFFAGLFFANGIPHFVNGISGRRFQSLFASPPGRGESTPLINVLWGSFNFIVAYLLLAGIGEFQGGLTADALALSLGFVLMSSILGVYFGRVRVNRVE